MIEVNDILEINTSGEHRRSNSEGSANVFKKPEQIRFKRPAGMHREVYSLLCAEGGLNVELVPLMPTDSPGGYKQKAKLEAKKVREWKWTPFTNPGRQDGAEFYHWARTSDPLKEYPFAKFNKEVPIPQYTEEEYTNHLDKDGWTKAKTQHLLDLCGRFDLRFPIIHDRWDVATYGCKSMEDLKDRYYFINNCLAKLRLEPGEEEPKQYVFDAEHEKKRKEQLKKMWSKTPEQVEEEEFLRAEQKIIELRRKAREKKTRDLQKLITAAETQFPGTSVVESVRGPAPRKKVSKDLRKSLLIAATKNATAAVLKRQLAAHSSDEVPWGIKWADCKTVGVYIRSSKMKLPGSVGQKKMRVIEKILLQLGVDDVPTPTEEITTQFNELRSDIVLLNELKSALSICEMQIQSLALQYKALTHVKLEIPSELFTTNSTSVILGTENEVTKSTRKVLVSTATQTERSALGGTLSMVQTHFPI